MQKQGFIAGAGIAGLAAAIALTRAGWAAQVFEKTSQFGEVGAGVQLGPNVTRILQHWGLMDALRDKAAYPDDLRARRLQDGATLAVLPLGERIAQRYGSPYLTIHRADLHSVLFEAAKTSGAGIHCDMPVHSITPQGEGLQIDLGIAGQLSTQYATMAIVAEGIWSGLRQTLLNDPPPVFTGHVAYRTLIKQVNLPLHLRTQSVHVWMGPRAHVVLYPVKGGEWLNVVCLVEGKIDHLDSSYRQSWDTPTVQSQVQADLSRAFQGACQEIRGLLDVCEIWRMWPLYGRPKMQGPHHHAQGRIALLGDAAHPMLPYLAQGAGMAIEDARQLELNLQMASVHSVANALQEFAQARWRRNARVQERSTKNGQIFHATGWTQQSRDFGLRLLGGQLMDMPWLYAAQ